MKSLGYLMVAGLALYGGYTVSQKPAVQETIAFVQRLRAAAPEAQQALEKLTVTTPAVEKTAAAEPERTLIVVQKSSQQALAAPAKTEAVTIEAVPVAA